MRPLNEARLYAILDASYLGGRSVGFYAREMVCGGADIIQLRAKGVPLETVREWAISVLPITRDAGVPLILNDYPALAAETGVDGVHVGQDDVSVRDAKKHVSCVGLSTHSLEQAKAAWVLPVPPDYIGFGPLFATPTKPDYRPVGTDDVRAVFEMSPIPVFCIGGIKLENIAAVIASGANRAVVVSGIMQAEFPSDYCQSLKQILLAGAVNEVSASKKNLR